MKVLLVMAGCLAMAGCAASPVAQAADESPRPVAANGYDCLAWRNFEGIDICRHADAVIQAADAIEVPALAVEHPQEVVGEERPHLVLDGAS
jgi:hypothetical protein